MFYVDIAGGIPEFLNPFLVLLQFLAPHLAVLCNGTIEPLEW